MTLLGFALAALIGLSLGTLGGGGSILTVPILVYVLGFPAKQAIAMSLPIVGATSLVGAVGHWRHGNVRVGSALPFGLVAMAGSFTGARVSWLVSGTTPLVLFGVIMLVAAARMYWSAEPRAAAAAAPRARALVLLIGFAVGVLTGLIGIGGGFLIVPALVLAARLPMKEAIGTSLLVIAMNATSGSAGYLGTVAMPWGFLALFTLVAIAGILAGTRLARNLPGETLRRAFAVLLVVVAGVMLLENLGGGAE
jgi:hypothetical protein